MMKMFDANFEQIVLITCVDIEFILRSKVQTKVMGAWTVN